MAGVLAIETSTFRGGAAVCIDGRVVCGVWAERSFGGEYLHSAVDFVVSGAGLSFSDLDAVVVDVGPGAFTALRVGIAAAKGFAFSLGLPLVGVSSLEVLCGGVVCSGVLVPVLDVRRGQVCGRVFERDGGELRALTDLVVAEPEGFCEVVGGVVGGGGALVFGTGAGLCDPYLSRGMEVLSGEFGFPLPHAAALLGHRVFSEGGGVDPASVVPVYVRDAV